MSGSAAYELDQRLSAVRHAREQHVANLSGGARERWEAEQAQHRAALSRISAHLSSLGQAGAVNLDSLRDDQRLVEAELEKLGTR